ncbi:MAG TPA: MFS transporter [Marmoricola sp.]|nr:MFS transporter [Nocardioidaceae bacterium]HRV68348.1 MFS transporter [Marmoricola sp.]
MATYGQMLKLPAVRRMLVISLIGRIPMSAIAVVLLIHVTQHLGHSYAMAGLLVAAETTAAAISGPWRGRKLDQIGLRASVLPSIIVMGAAWAIAPWVSYWPLVALAFIGALMMIPTFAIVRQVLIDAVPESDRKAVLALDSITTEIAFMVGPILGVWLATSIDTRVAILVVQLFFVLGGLMLWIENPPLGQSEEDKQSRQPLRSWISMGFVSVLIVCFTAVFVLMAGDIGAISALQEMGQPKLAGLVLATWAFGSMLGAGIYGIAHRPIKSYWLLLVLGLTTIPVALATTPTQLAILLFVSGFMCGPTLSATIEDVSHAVPIAVRGEAMGWHGSALMAGGAAGGPVIGLAVDHAGWPSGFVVAGLVGVVVAFAALLVTRARRSSQALFLSSGK